MSAAIGKAFATMGDSFLRSYQSQLDRNQRQKEYDDRMAWENEQRGRQRQQWSRDDEVDRTIRETMAPVQGMESSTVTDRAGSAASTADPDAAAYLRDMSLARDQDGGAAINRSQRIEGQDYMDPGLAQAALTRANDPYQRQVRTADAVSAIDPSRGIKMRNDAMQSRAAQLQLNKAEQAELNEQFNTNLLRTLDSAPTWYEGAAAMVEQVTGGKAQGQAELSEDGKKVNIFIIGPDGQRQLSGSYDAGTKGKLEFVNKSAKQDPQVKLGFLSSMMQFEIQREEAERARREKGEDRDADFANQKELLGLRFQNDRALRGMSGGGGGGAGQLVQVAGPDGKPTYARIQGDRLVPVDMGGMALPTKSARDINPADYAKTVEGFVGSGMSITNARIEADKLFGRAPPAPQGGVDPDLQERNKAAVAATAPKPAPAAAQAQSFAPQNRQEYVAVQQALAKGYYPAGRRETMFGSDILFQDKAGNRVWQSDLNRQ